jgi:hypothetical protein
MGALSRALEADDLPEAKRLFQGIVDRANERNRDPKAWKEL